MLDPTARPGAQAGSLAPRARSLRGATVGLLNNSKRNSDLLLEAIGRELKDQYGVAEVIELGKPSASYVVSAQLQNDLAKCHAIITGVGD
ncbi:MAG: hypothetical protein JO057_10810 [Chloroflexi bacterium]|nr:hypothetical protein [Chloroflexota bacterium]